MFTLQARVDIEEAYTWYGAHRLDARTIPIPWHPVECGAVCRNNQETPDSYSGTPPRCPVSCHRISDTGIMPAALTSSKNPRNVN